MNLHSEMDEKFPSKRTVSQVVAIGLARSESQLIIYLGGWPGGV
jgi:hypothetical protein